MTDLKIYKGEYLFAAVSKKIQVYRLGENSLDFVYEKTLDGIIRSITSIKNNVMIASFYCHSTVFYNVEVSPSEIKITYKCQNYDLKNSSMCYQINNKESFISDLNTLNLVLINERPTNDEESFRCEKFGSINLGSQVVKVAKGSINYRNNFPDHDSYVISTNNGSIF